MKSCLIFLLINLSQSFVTPTHNFLSSNDPQSMCDLCANDELDHKKNFLKFEDKESSKKQSLNVFSDQFKNHNANKNSSFKKVLYYKYRDVVLGDDLYLMESVDERIYNGELLNKFQMGSDFIIKNDNGDYFIQYKNGGFIYSQRRNTPFYSLDVEIFQPLDGGYKNLEDTLQKMYPTFSGLFNSGVQELEKEKLFKKISKTFKRYIAIWTNTRGWSGYINENKLMFALLTWNIETPNGRKVIIRPAILHER